MQETEQCELTVWLVCN